MVDVTTGAAGDGSPLERSGWLRAAVLGANDGIVSTSALVIGMAASQAPPRAVLLAGLAGLVAGAASMAVGEYVSVSTQRDIEKALRAREHTLLSTHPNVSITELAIALQLRGIDPGLARTVAEQIVAAQPVEANVRVKYGITEGTAARPVQAALASAASFAMGAAMPLLGLAAPAALTRMVLAVVIALVALAACGATAAGLGGAARGRGALRVVAGGILAMILSAVIGHLVGAVV
jgi:VIT1/CCC1 family predicted Fe2+/Mn2+ transporter